MMIQGEQTHKFVKFIGSLERHQATVNAVKFSKNGLHLASASDGIFFFLLITISYSSKIPLTIIRLLSGREGKGLNVLEVM